MEAQKLKRVWRFMVSDVWDIELSSLSALRSLGVRLLRVVHLVFKGFREDECPLHASSLTFNTLMAIVPILALSLGLARGMGGADLAKNKIRDAIGKLSAAVVVTETTAVAPAAVVTNAVADVTAGRGEALAPETVAQINQRVEAWLFENVENISFATLGGFGLVLLIWMVMSVLGRIESSFNRVWGITSVRPLWRKFTDYLSLLFVLPVLIVAASSIPIVDFAAKFFDENTQQLIRSSLGSGFVKLMTVFVMTSLTFSFLIMFMPNTKVRLRPGLVGGLVSGVLFILWLRLCAALQVGVARSSAIYGSFAIVPIVLAWVYVSWEIILFGAEVAFAVQNCTTYKMEQGSSRANVLARIQLALSVITEAARAMISDAPAFEASRFAREKLVPVRFLNDIVEDLVKGGFLAQLSENKGGFVLLKAPENLSVRDVVEFCMTSGVKPEALGLKAIDPMIERVVNELTDGVGNILKESTVKDLIA